MKQRIYIQVEVRFLPDGRMLPGAVIWHDGRRFPVEQVLDVCPGAVCCRPDAGDRYTVRIRSRETRLWFERSGTCGGTRLGRWFVEPRDDAGTAMRSRLRENLAAMAR